MARGKAPPDGGPPLVFAVAVAAVAAAAAASFRRALRARCDSPSPSRRNNEDASAASPSPSNAPPSPPSASGDWKPLTAAIRAALAPRGLDVVAPLRLRWYNDVAPPSATIAPAGARGDDALVVLVGNSRALWPAFCDAHVADPEIGDAADPVDAYVAREVAAAVRAARDADPTPSSSSPSPSSSSSSPPPPPPPRPRVFYAHETKPGRLVAIQRMAHVAGVAHLDESCHLSIHPTLGPWLAFRAVLVFDDVAGPDRGDVPPTPPNPLADDPIARRRVDDAFDAALAGYEDPDGGRETQWRRWVAVRDAVRPGHPERYGEEQVRYHYNCLDGRERERIRARLRRSSRAREDDAGERRGENDREGGPEAGEAAAGEAAAGEAAAGEAAAGEAAAGEAA